MLDEYRYEQENRLHRRLTLQHWHVWFAVICTIVLLSLQILTLIDTVGRLSR